MKDKKDFNFNTDNPDESHKNIAGHALILGATGTGKTTALILGKNGTDKISLEDKFVAVDIETKEEFYLDNIKDQSNYPNCVMFSRENYLKNKEYIWLDLFVSSAKLEDLEKLENAIKIAYKKYHNIDKLN